ncbi:MAG TPA: DUF1080 domain-containing protein [Planctomicrobium sp.]|nr:DUF1080 domain-containing protein [Planctomicrobium sp.]
MLRLTRSVCTICLVTCFVSVVFVAGASAAERSLFDGKTLAGWQGETEKTWRVEEGVVVGGSLAGNPQNEFLAASERFENFDLKFKAKLEGTEGFVNGGVQFRSERIPNHHEMIGYQADIGMGYDGGLYDESRRNKFLQSLPKEEVAKIVKAGEWNEYRVRAEGPRVQIWVNGVQTVDYTETESAIPRSGLIALQIHGNCKAVIRFKEIVIEKLP